MTPAACPASLGLGDTEHELNWPKKGKPQIHGGRGKKGSSQLGRCNTQSGEERTGVLRSKAEPAGTVGSWAGGF